MENKSSTVILCERAKAASRKISLLSDQKINEALLSMAKKLVENKTAAELEWVSSDPLRKEYFSLLLKESDPGVLVTMIRLIHSKRTELAQNGKRLRAADEKAFSEAKKAVSEELSFALGTDRENVIDMILGN